MKYLIDRETLLGIAALIRAEEKSSAPIPVSQFESRLRAILDGKTDKPGNSTPDDSPTEEQPLYKIGLLSDVHIQYDTDQDGNGNTDWKDACLWYQSNNVDAICIAGDLTRNGTESELIEWKTARDSARGTIPVYSSSGNHESKQTTSLQVTNPSSILPYLDSDTTTSGNPYFYKTINNDIYIFMPVFIGTAQGNSGMFNTASLDWLENLLETYRNQRVLLFEHIPPSPTLVGNFGTGNGAYDYYSVSTNTSDKQRFLNMMSHYKNVVWFSGHSHIKWEYEASYPGLNYARYNNDGARMIHLSSTTVPKDIIDGSVSDNIYAEGEAAIMEVYANKIVVKGYDLITKSYISEMNLNIDTTPVTISASDSTPSVPDTPVVTLSSISATKSTKSYNVGDTVETNDISVTALYSDGSTENVTGWTSSTVDTSSAGTKTMIISYGGKTTTISIVINAATVVEPEPSHEDINVPINWTLGNLDTSTGNVSSSTSYAYSQKIEHAAGNTYTIATSYTQSGYPRIVCVEYNSNDSIIGATEYIVNGATQTSGTYTPSANTSKFVMKMTAKSGMDSYKSAVTLVRHA